MREPRAGWTTQTSQRHHQELCLIQQLRYDDLSNTTPAGHKKFDRLYLRRELAGIRVSPRSYVREVGALYMRDYLTPLHVVNGHPGKASKESVGPKKNRYQPKSQRPAAYRVTLGTLALRCEVEVSSSASSSYHLSDGSDGLVVDDVERQHRGLVFLLVLFVVVVEGAKAGADLRIGAYEEHGSMASLCVRSVSGIRMTSPWRSE